MITIRAESEDEYVGVVTVGLVLLIVPGVYLAVRFAPFGYVLGSRSVSPRGALRAAAALVAGRWWSTFGLLLGLLVLDLAGIAFLGVGSLVTFPVSMLAASSYLRGLERSSVVAAA